MKKIKHIIAFFFIALILLIKVAGLHALSEHSDETDVEHCEICHISSAASFTPFLKTEFTVLLPTDFFFSEQKSINNNIYVAFNNWYLESNLFTRPPPQL